MRLHYWIMSIGVLLALIAVPSVSAAISLNNNNLVYDGSGNPYWLITQPGSYYVDITGTTFTTQAQFGIVVRASDVVIDGRGKTLNGGTAKSWNSNSYGIWVSPDGHYSGVQTKNIIIENKTYGVQYGFVSEGSVENVIVRNNGCGVYLYNSTGNIISRVNADRNSFSGIFLRFSSSENTLTLNTVTNTIDPEDPDNLARGYGIQLDSGCNNNMVKENSLSGNRWVGIYAHDSHFNTIENNLVTNNFWGIHSDELSHNNAILQNRVIGNSWGIVLDPTTHHNNLTLNEINDSQESAIFLWGSSDNTISLNSATGNTHNGIFIRDASSRNTVTSNTVTGSDYGIEIEKNSNNNNVQLNTVDDSGIVGLFISSSIGNTFHKNTLSDAVQNGILCDYSSTGNILSANTISGSMYGIGIGHESNGNTIQGNWVNGSSVHSIYILSSRSNSIYNNFFFGPPAGIGGTESSNIWNVAKSAGPNIIGGPYIGGNFWGNPQNQGFSDQNSDNDGDGFCDSSYALGFGYQPENRDYLPLHEVTASLPGISPFYTLFRSGAVNNWLFSKDLLSLEYSDSFGMGNDLPLIGDLNNDNAPDRAVFRDGEWIFDLNMDGSVDTRNRYGQAGDLPLAGIMNSDDIPDRGVFRKGQWIIDLSMDGTVDLRNYYGLADDIPLIGDFNNDDNPDRAVFRSSAWNNWIIDYNFDGTVDVRNRYGQSGDIPVVGDFNLDGRIDRAVFRDDEWIFDYDMNGDTNFRCRFGQDGDIPGFLGDR